MPSPVTKNSTRVPSTWGYRGSSGWDTPLARLQSLPLMRVELLGRHMRDSRGVRVWQDGHQSGAEQVQQLRRHHLCWLRGARQRDGGGAHGLPPAHHDHPRRPRGVHHEAHHPRECCPPLNPCLCVCDRKYERFSGFVVVCIYILSVCL